MARCTFVVSLVLALVSVAFAQNSPQSDSQAVVFATQSLTALTNGVTVSDVTLSGNAVWMSGTKSETGTATAYGKTTVGSRLDLALSGGNRSELRNSAGGSPRGAWVNASGKLTTSASHNCWTDAVWFFPALTSLSAVNRDHFYFPQAKLVWVYVGLETRNDRSVQHIQSYQHVASKIPRESVFTKKMSTVDYYLDAPTLVPLSIAFTAHPDNEPTTNIAVEVEFSDYQLAKGVMVPFHVTKLWQGNPLLDFTVTRVAINSALSDSLFSTH